jgi:hypothetical protein
MLTKLAAAVVAATMMLGPALAAETNPGANPATNPPTQQGAQATQPKVSHHMRHHHMHHAMYRTRHLHSKQRIASHKKQHLASHQRYPRSVGHAATRPQTKQPGY